MQETGKRKGKSAAVFNAIFNIILILEDGQIGQNM
jgi:hypothetical protein